MKMPSYMPSKCPVLLATGLGGIFTVVNFAFAQGWTISDAPAGSWKTVACSADGARMVAGGYFTDADAGMSPKGIYISADSGMTWTETTAPSNFWTSVVSSADGAKLVAAARSAFYPSWVGPIYRSADAGATWTQSTAPSNYWSAVASSAEGSKLVAVARATYDDTRALYVGAPIYTSANSGETWTQTTAPSNNWTAVASSADGTKLVAVAQGFGPNPSAAGQIYLSSDSGATWTLTTAPTTNRWTSVAASADGTKLVAVDWATVCTSTDSGVTWSLTSGPDPSGYERFVALSADGSKLVAVDRGGSSGPGGPIYTSSDSGATWSVASSILANWRSVASSADGSKLVAVADEGWDLHPPLIAVSLMPPPTPRLNIGTSGAGLGISWLVPSTRFVLQQNSDLTATNWTDVPATPTLNLTNLHYEVSASPSLGSRFYRLKQQ